MKRKRVGGYGRRTKTRVRRRVTAKRYGGRGMRRSRLPSQIVKFQRTFWSSAWVPDSTTTAGFWKNPSVTLGNLPSVSEITSLFDQYKIAAVKFKFIPKFSEFDGSASTALGQVHMSIVNDPYSTVVPSGTYQSSTYNAFAENGRVKQYAGNRNVVVYFKPTVSDNMAAGGTRRLKSPWLLTSNTGEPHYGFHCFAHTPNFTGFPATPQVWDIMVTLYILARRVR